MRPGRRRHGLVHANQYAEQCELQMRVIGRHMRRFHVSKRRGPVVYYAPLDRHDLQLQQLEKYQLRKLGQQ